MARGRAPGYEEQRELILREAARLFAELGYPGTSMNQVAQACGLSKPALYHYFRDKYDLLVQIAEGHIARLQVLVDEVGAQALAPPERLRELIGRFVREYAQARDAHRVLTEDVKFLRPEDAERILGTERAVVAAFADTIAEQWPQVGQAHLAKPTTMLLFGMINWMFTWFRPDGSLDYDAMAPVVADLFCGGVTAVKPPQGMPAKRRARIRVVPTGASS
ncbi:MAG: TetR family transcriptional regulator [Comamonas sp. SCN 65-56]|uniref:TetR/AcrR family transcriptional regulator n=1 Tax=Comamonas sp. SCN 65-56 TaxID=1660095 RepID=UPI00086E2031|nr:TetR/AcrR family transcriptional regulator [Comamonas sp. SCN 65-56]ODS90922.1 MAG: TetR family transcriptional regulator [Comamonas sp. SCN 65-56]